jgi:hypothetical protein
MVPSSGKEVSANSGLEVVGGISLGPWLGKTKPDGLKCRVQVVNADAGGYKQRSIVLGFVWAMEALLLASGVRN